MYPSDHVAGMLGSLRYMHKGNKTFSIQNKQRWCCVSLKTMCACMEKTTDRKLHSPWPTFSGFMMLWIHFHHPYNWQHFDSPTITASIFQLFIFRYHQMNLCKLIVSLPCCALHPRFPFFHSITESGALS